MCVCVCVRAGGLACVCDVEHFELHLPFIEEIKWTKGLNHLSNLVQ